MITVKKAKLEARDWVVRTFGGTTDLIAAFYHGSINWKADEELFPATSDLDIIVVTKNVVQDPKKFFYRDLILDLSWFPENDFKNAADILGNYYLAGDFRHPNIIIDVDGSLGKLQTEIAVEFNRKIWVTKRCHHAMQNALQFFRKFDESVNLHDQVTNWLFARGVMTHILLTAGLKNPTVRRRYMDAKKMLDEYGRVDLYEELLSLSGFNNIDSGRAMFHLNTVNEVFDIAKSLIKTPYRFATDISDSTKHIAIDGSLELIKSGMHREAMFWIVAVFSRCMHVLRNDAPVQIFSEWESKLRLLLAELGIHSTNDFQLSNHRAKEFLNKVNNTSEEIIRRNAEIRD